MAVPFDNAEEPRSTPAAAAAPALPPVPAIVLAGDKRGSHPVFGVNKNLLEVGGEPLVRHVVRTLLTVDEISAIYAVGPVAGIEAALDGLPEVAGRPLTIVPQRETIVQNCWQGFRRSLSDDPAADPERLKRENAGAVALFLPGDLPFLEAAEVRHFLRHADMSRFDYLLGLTRMDPLDRVVTEAGVPELRKPALQLAEGRMRQSNLHLIRPFAVRHLEVFDRFYEVRYQKEFWNAFKVALSVLRASGGFSRPLFYYLFAQTAMRLDLWGLRRLADWLRQRVPMPKVCVAMSRFTGCRFGFLAGAGAGAVLDVDSERDLELTRRHLDHLRSALLAGWHAEA